MKEAISSKKDAHKTMCQNRLRKIKGSIKACKNFSKESNFKCNEREPDEVLTE